MFQTVAVPAAVTLDEYTVYVIEFRNEPLPSSNAASASPAMPANGAHTAERAAHADGAGARRGASSSSSSATSASASASSASLIYRLRRRYRELFDLHEALSKAFPDEQFAEFPPKVWMNNRAPEVIEERRRKLEDYLVSVLQRPHVRGHYLFLAFLKGGERVDIETRVDVDADTSLMPSLDADARSSPASAAATASAGASALHQAQQQVAQQQQHEQFVRQAELQQARTAQHVAGAPRSSARSGGGYGDASRSPPNSMSNGKLQRNDALADAFADIDSIAERDAAGFGAAPPLHEGNNNAAIQALWDE